MSDQAGPHTGGQEGALRVQRGSERGSGQRETVGGLEEGSNVKRNSNEQHL